MHTNELISLHDHHRMLQALISLPNIKVEHNISILVLVFNLSETIGLVFSKI